MLTYYAALLDFLHCLCFDLKQSFAHLAACKTEQPSSSAKNDLFVLDRNNLINNADLPTKQLSLLVVDHPQLRRGESRSRDEVNNLFA